MIYEYRCLASSERFTLNLSHRREDLHSQPCAGCQCSVRDGEPNRVFSTFAITHAPEPYRPGTLNKYTDEVHATQRDYEKYMDDHQLEVRRA